jgi:hypothetical protein
LHLRQQWRLVVQNRNNTVGRGGVDLIQVKNREQRRIIASRAESAFDPRFVPGTG